MLVTLSPCGSLKTLEFMRWLGVSVPRTSGSEARFCRRAQRHRASDTPHNHLRDNTVTAGRDTAGSLPDTVAHDDSVGVCSRPPLTTSRSILRLLGLYQA